MPLKLDNRGRLKVSETEVQKGCMDLLRLNGWIVRPSPKQGQRTKGTAYEVPAGEPDLIAVRWKHGSWQVLLIECKSAAGKLSESQTVWATDFGVLVYVIRSVDQLRALLPFVDAGGGLAGPPIAA